MNENELRAEIVRKGLTIPKLAELAGMSKKTLYSKIKGFTSFKQGEISKVSEILCLSDNQILSIFFNNKVS